MQGQSSVGRSCIEENLGIEIARRGLEPSRNKHEWDCHTESFEEY